jgi:hypothetical protein
MVKPKLTLGQTVGYEFSSGTFALADERIRNYTPAKILATTFLHDAERCVSG